MVSFFQKWRVQVATATLSLTIIDTLIILNSFASSLNELYSFNQPIELLVVPTRTQAINHRLHKGSFTSDAVRCGALRRVAARSMTRNASGINRL